MPLICRPLCRVWQKAGSWSPAAGKVKGCPPGAIVGVFLGAAVEGQAVAPLTQAQRACRKISFCSLGKNHLGLGGHCVPNFYYGNAQTQRKVEGRV